MNTEPAGPCWYALTVRPNHERTAARGLSRQGFDVYVPLHKYCRRWSDRVKEVESVLFPGYVFCRFALEDRLRILRSPGVCSIVGGGKRTAPVSQEEINAVRAVANSAQPISPCPYVHIGDRKVSGTGYLENIRGVTVRVNHAWRVIVSVEALGASLSVEAGSAMPGLDSWQPDSAGQDMAPSASLATALTPAFSRRPRSPDACA